MPPLTRRRLLGLDRSGGPPPETGRDQPLHPWTIPNAIGFVRIGLIPVFLVLALDSGDGRDTAATILFAFIAATDYLDGMVARLTGQYSRLGALLDPLTDRLLVISGAIVAWEFELLPRWALPGPEREHARPLGGLAHHGGARPCDDPRDMALGGAALSGPGVDACGHRPVSARWATSPARRLKLYLRNAIVACSLERTAWTHFPT
jgi:hypothetical protein